MIKKLNGENFETEVLNNSGIVLVDFYADWCGPCKMLAPVLEEIANERDDVVIGKVNVDEAPEIAAKYRILSIPAMYLFKDGEIVARWVGFHSKDQINNLVDGYLYGV